jgi:hypothetical protein
LSAMAASEWPSGVTVPRPVIQTASLIVVSARLLT